MKGLLAGLRQTPSWLEAPLLHLHRHHPVLQNHNSSCQRYAGQWYLPGYSHICVLYATERHSDLHDNHNNTFIVHRYAD